MKKIARLRIACFLPLLLLAGCSKSAPETASTTPAGTAPALAARPGAPGTPSVKSADAGRAAVSPMGSEEMAGEAPALPPPAPVVIPRGTVLRVRLNSGLSTKSSAPGDRFTATLQDPVVVDGEVLVPKGAACGGHVTESSASGRMRGRAQLAVTLDSIEVRGRKHNIRTSSVARTSSGHAKRNAGFIGGGAGLGAVLGAIAGGGRGAAIGAAAGAGAGTAGAAATGKQNAALPAEALVTFSLRAPVSL